MSYFTPSGSAGSTSTVVISGVNNPTITDINILLTNTEQSYVLPANTKRYTVQVYNLSHLKLAYAVGTSGTVFARIAGNAFLEEDNVSAASLTLYVQSPATGVVARILSWT